MRQTTEPQSLLKWFLRAALKGSQAEGDFTPHRQSRTHMEIEGQGYNLLSHPQARADQGLPFLLLPKAALPSPSHKWRSDESSQVVAG